MKYLVLMHVDREVIQNLDEATRKTIMDGHRRFIEETTDSGEMLSTHALGDPSQTVTLRGGPDGPTVSDGPFAETKEFMGGYYLLDVESGERAVELAHRIPDTSIAGMNVEVRPVMFSAGDDL